MAPCIDNVKKLWPTPLTSSTTTWVSATLGPETLKNQWFWQDSALPPLCPPISEAKPRLRPSLDQARSWFQTAHLRLCFAVGARRIPVASRKPARAEEEDMCMPVQSTVFAFLASSFIYLECHLLWFSCAHYAPDPVCSRCLCCLVHFPV